MLLKPYECMVEVQVNGSPVLLPEGNTLLRGFQSLAPQDISYGPFCWNQHCGSCVVEYDLGDGTQKHGALACELVVSNEMRIRTLKPIFSYCVRSLVSTEVAR